jgi:hypothetical protein
MSEADIVVPQAKTLLQRGIAYRTAQSPGAKDAVLDAFGELSAAVYVIALTDEDVAHLLASAAA